MIVADTSALISLAVADCFDVVVDEFDLHTTTVVERELRETAAYDDPHGRGESAVLDHFDRLAVHEISVPTIQSTRIDEGEASCLALLGEVDARYLVTDDYRATAELRSLAEARVTLSPILLRALVERGVLSRSDALARYERLADRRDWLEAPIHRRARRLLEE